MHICEKSSIFARFLTINDISMKKIGLLCAALCLGIALCAQNEVLFYESFDQCIGYGTPGTDDYEEMGYTGGNDNQYGGNIATGVILPDNSDWQSDYAYGAFECAKVGHSKYAGHVTTPTISCTGDVQLTFRAAPWSGDSLMNIQVTGGTADKTAFTLKKNDWTQLSVSITDITDGVKIKFYSINKHRFFLDDVTLLPPDPDAASIRLTAGTTVDFGFLGKSYAKQYANVQIVGTNLKSNITVNFTQNDNKRFAASMRSLPSEGGKLTVSFETGADAGRYSGTIQLSATGKNNETVTKLLYIGAEVSDLNLEGSGTKMDPYTVGDVILLAANEGTVWRGTQYWVKGYVLGAVKRYNNDQFDGICDNDKTSLVLGRISNETDYNKIVTVELVSGNARNALNVVDNAQLIGQMIKVRGELLNSKANPNYLQKPGVHGVKNNDQYVRPWDQDEPDIYDPTIVTKSEQVKEAKDETTKVIRDGQLYILWRGHIFNAQGQLITSGKVAQSK